jgi:hypothetical protein
VRALTASAAGLAPVKPPAGWFANPKRTEPTPLVVESSGRVYGHAWPWNTCHIGFPGSCVPPPPKGSDDFAHFQLGEILCLGGKTRHVGHITIDTPHAPNSMSAGAAAHHYGNTGACVADVTMGEDEHGAWFAGALRPDCTPADVRVLRSSPVSGDWRRFGGRLQLVGLLATNVPGFHILRKREALVASGVLTRRRVDVARNRQVRALVASAQAPDTLRELVVRARGETT